MKQNLPQDKPQEGTKLESNKEHSGYRLLKKSEGEGAEIKGRSREREKAREFTLS